MLTLKLRPVTYKLFQRRAGDPMPSTQFAATIVALPGAEEAAPSTWVPSLPPSPDGNGPDTSATDFSSLDTAGLDVVTDIGGVPSEIPDPSDAPTISHIGRY